MLAFLSFYTTVAKIIIQNQTISYFEKKERKIIMGSNDTLYHQGL